MNKKFDFDLIAPFKRNAFDTLEKMYTAVYDFLYEKYKNLANVRKQKVSVGIEFYADADGDVVKIDVVPGRELNKDQYKNDNKLNLYVYSQFGKLDAGSDRLQSNVKAQIQNIKDNADKTSLREIIRLLKIWKIHLDKRYKSFFIELITIKAFDKKDITGDLWERLKAVLEYIRDNVKEVSLPDPGNSNNDVADTLTDSDKSELSQDMKYMVENIEANSDSIKLYFIPNSEFPCEEEKSLDNRYGEKAIGISIPPQNDSVEMDYRIATIEKAITEFTSARITSPFQKKKGR
ncbi:hypothetical protein [Paraflavitalea speifideaquila]|uniref:hypothetical protein n=1 Tax=Paraflavitalea speifideaquila TaxID=3076558 RepID=UPI0028E3BDBB|nr:hypothetical protein [Paraflavitalea speifideiaquila]